MPTTTGLDLYAGNGTVDLAKAKTEDAVQFVIHKATEGADFTDSAFPTMWQRITDEGLQPGAYHFARPDNGNTPQAEAHHFLTVLGGRRGILALDGERLPRDWSLARLADWYAGWLQVVTQESELNPFLYTYHRWAFTFDFAALRSAYPLWIPLDPTATRQITQTAKVIGTLGTLDVDTYGGTLAELQQAAGLAPQTQAQPSQGKGTSMVIVRDGTTGREYLQTDDGALHYLGNPETVTAYKGAGVGVADPVDTNDLKQFPGYVTP